MADHQDAPLGAQAQKDEPVFLSGSLRVVNQERVLVQEHGLRFLKRNIVLSQVELGSTGIPREPQLVHTLQCSDRVGHSQGVSTVPEKGGKQRSSPAKRTLMTPRALGTASTPRLVWCI